MREALIPLLPCLLFGACAGGGGEPAAEDAPVPLPPGLMAGSGAGGSVVTPGGNRPVDLVEGAGTVLDEEQIAFTDPDTGELPPELGHLLAEDRSTEGPWGKSDTLTFRSAMRTDTPVLIWFTDSRSSPNCRALIEDLFNRGDFEEWAAETFVRLQVDQQIEGSKIENDAARKADYVKELKERYRVMGHPTLLVLTPSREVIARYRGYRRGQAEFRWGQLRQSAKLAAEAHAKYKKRMERKGFRTWTDPRGRTIFAKLLGYRDGELALVEPDGTRSRTKVRNLSPPDQDWVERWKRARGIE